ncbi:ubiquinol-cytochrome C chaperone family protein [Bauldia sp.]|uniref:ubiquinol-cytochrome C chaperone family protein n=1 Tax=Bauldia sp. TaxID=2575872 RepID=UPI003BAC40CF
MAQSRNPVFYRDLGVADTVDGRFESVVLHLVIVLRRLRAGDQAAREAGQAVFDRFCLDMDRSMREAGVGDLSVGKRMRKVGEVFYGRSEAYDRALDAGDSAALAGSLERAVPAAEGAELATNTLAAYMIATDRAMSDASDSVLFGGELPFIRPERFVSAETEK